MDRSACNASLSAKLGLPGSSRMARMWEILLTDEEAEIADLLPGTVDEISARTDRGSDEVNRICHSLFHKGVAFTSSRGEEKLYRLAKNIVQLHDACLLWPGAGEEFFQLWKLIMDEDFSGMMKGLPDSVRLPSFMRVIPVHASVDARSEVLSYEECESLINSSSQVAVVTCPCRLSQRNCDAPLETCIQLNRGAAYVLERGHGRAITKEEAMAIIRQAEEAGLVHMTENRLKGNAICNCCTCCCEMFRLAAHSGKKWILAPSRFRAQVNDHCTGCGACLEVCPADAIDLNGTASIHDDSCLGCGLCATACVPGAITLIEVRDKDFIPGS